MEILRIIITGTIGAGKTSLIRTISEIEVVDTDKRATDEVADIKSSTTVALDFGRLTIGKNQSLHLYGTPGQPRFDFMWDILIQKANAYILLVNAHRPEQLRQSRKMLYFLNQRVTIPYLIGLTHTDYPDAWEVEDIALGLGLDNQETHPLIININPTQPESVREGLITLVEQFTPIT
ncbi:MAG: GTPase [Calothrix sp. CSU_2_0]|nr:GTPase [Calothrix sp. CSU_2_0]